MQERRLPHGNTRPPIANPMKTHLHGLLSGRFLKLILVGMALPLLSCLGAGCQGIAFASGTAYATHRGARKTSASEVQIYLDPPAKYETLGFVESETTNCSLAPDATQNLLFDGLKRQAAKLGADGVILLDTDTRTVTPLGFTQEKSAGYSVFSEKKTAKGKAIRVIRE